MKRHRPGAVLIRRVRAVALFAGAGAGPAACGGETEYANAPRPASPINVTAVITEDRVRISPRSFGAGPIVLIVANQSRLSQEFTLESAADPGGDEAGIRQTTSAVNPRGTAELKVDVVPGTYRLSVRSQGVRPFAVRVGRARPSAQNELLEP